MDDGNHSGYTRMGMSRRWFGRALEIWQVWMHYETGNSFTLVAVSEGRLMRVMFGGKAMALSIMERELQLRFLCILEKLRC